MRLGLTAIVVAGVLLVAVVVLDPGRVREMLDSDVTRVRNALRDAAWNFGIDPDILDAIGKVEGPEWKLDAFNGTGGDAARGNAYGPTQITTETARGYGYAGDMEAFRSDPLLAAHWTALIMSRRPGGPPLTIEDASAWWNAGHATAAQLPELDKHGQPFPTRVVYIPKAQAAYVYVHDNPPAPPAMEA